MNHKFKEFKHDRFSHEQSLKRGLEFCEMMSKRRSIRSFSNEKFDIKLIRTAILTAGTAPSGANKQPWRFVIVESPEIKKEIRTAAEKEEKESYERRMSQSWLDDLAPLGTDWHKEFLTTAPWLIVIFKKAFDTENGEKSKNYYVNESVGIAAGFLIAAIHMAGLVTLTHTPSPMNFLQHILNRPDNERPFLLLPVGYPADGVQVPDLWRKEVKHVLRWY